MPEYLRLPDPELLEDEEYDLEELEFVTTENRNITLQEILHG